jgi:hypothetical protein
MSLVLRLIVNDRIFARMIALLVGKQDQVVVEEIVVGKYLPFVVDEGVISLRRQVVVAVRPQSQCRPRLF